jgi:hypothetical protein
MADKIKLAIDEVQVISSRGNNKNFMHLFLSSLSVYLRGLSSGGTCHCVVGRMTAGDKGTMFF